MLNQSQDGRYTWEDLQEIMERLRGEDGCPWDRIQTHETLKTPLLEEVYEVLESIETKDMSSLCEELGDLLLQIFFHARLAEEKKIFSLGDVVHGICTKLIRRHPHVFQEKKVDGVEEALKTWSQIKQDEKKDRDSILHDVSSRQPALMWAFKVQKKAAEVGFDWEDIGGAFEKFKEEERELEKELSNGGNLEEELGDLFFSLVNVSRFLDFSPEVVLRKAVRKFIKRFLLVEKEVLKQEEDWQEIPLEELEKYWEQAKRKE